MQPDGSIDRGALGGIVFANAEKRRALELITHPAVAAAVASEVDALQRQGQVSHVLYDVPLLFERSLEASFEGVVVVWVPKAVQMARLVTRDNLTVTAATQRLAAQMSLDDKRQRARWVVDNSGTLNETEAQVEEIWREMRQVDLP